MTAYQAKPDSARRSIVHRAWISGGPAPVLLAGAFARSVWLLFSGRVRLPRASIGRTVPMENGDRFRVFRQLRLTSGPGRRGPAADAAPGGEFRVTFATRMPARLNVAFSWLPIPLFIGLPGFVDKTWMIDDATGRFAGVYHWRTAEDAARYASSPALRFMTRRSVPGSLAYGCYSPPNPGLEAPWPPAGGSVP